MKRFIALAAGLGLAACAHDPGAGAKAKTISITNPVKHVLGRITISPDLAGNAAPQVFEQALCSKLFELNLKQVVCADEIRILLEHQRDQALITNSEEANPDEVLKQLEAPRRISLNAARVGEVVAVTVLVQNAGATVAHFQVPLRLDGGDVFDRAAEAAVKILQVK